MKATLEEANPIHYIDYSDIIHFIYENSDMSWNEVCDFVSNTGIVSDDQDYTFRNKGAYEYLSDEAQYWLKNFFEVHPWLDEILIVFTD